MHFDEAAAVLPLPRMPTLAGVAGRRGIRITGPSMQAGTSSQRLFRSPSYGDLALFWVSPVL
jgi:hypothetical protein